MAWLASVFSARHTLVKIKSPSTARQTEAPPGVTAPAWHVRAPGGRSDGQSTNSGDARQLRQTAQSCPWVHFV